MIGASKILTVSYGTFSCTLEGFDDPFNTMKAIAEYFRDLAAEDRYFGAEPPQPDAAMLHRIAEREIQRRVEARVQDNGVILRADADVAPMARLAEPGLATAPAPTPVQSVTPAVIPAVVPAPQAAAVTESVAAKLSKLRAAKAATEVVAPDFPAATELDEPEALLPDPGLAEFIAPEAVAEPAREPVVETLTLDEAPASEAPESAVAEVAQVEAEAAVAEAAEPVVVAVAEVHAETGGLSLPDDLAEELDDAAALALSNALAGLGDEADSQKPEHSIEELFPEGDALPDDVEDILPESAGVAEDVDLSALIANVGPDVEATVVQTEAVAEETLQAAEIDLETLIGSLSEETRIAEAKAEPENEIAAVAEVEAGPAEIEILEVAEIEPVADDLAPVAQTAPEKAEPAAAWSDDEDETEAGVAPAPVRPEMAEKLQRARARVVRIHRADVVEPAPAAAAQAIEPQEASEPRRKLDAQADDAALNRLIAQTNTEMEGPDAKRRLSAIAHLKAAVAATVAERLTRGKPASTEAARAEPYRDDLARAVRPVRPEAPGARGDRPAPLVLVSEQRIDRPAPAAPAQPPAHVSPVRPRRVTSAALAVQADDDDEDEEDSTSFADTRGFVEFADKLGVRSLPDLMEAAAAYTASVEGRPHFSRPHLIKHLSAARGVEIPREDSLRTFGRLLREGRIEKIKRGQFAVNEGSRFLTEARKING